MATLRKKLEPQKDSPQYIQTHIGVGYRMLRVDWEKLGNKELNRYAIENLFGIEGLNIVWYGIIITCGMVLGFALAIYRCRKTGINKEHIYNLALWLIPVCIICARAYYVIFEWDNYKNDLLSVFEINRWGLAIYGGVLGGVAVALIYCKVKRISFWSPADTLMPSLVLWQAMGRWGNFVNQEAYGNQICLLYTSPSPRD